MIIKRIEGANADIARDQPDYRTLPCKVRSIAGGFEFSSAHEPTPEELKRLNRGATIILIILATQHPPCRLEVGEIPE